MTLYVPNVVKIARYHLDPVVTNQYYVANVSVRKEVPIDPVVFLTEDQAEIDSKTKETSRLYVTNAVRTVKCLSDLRKGNRSFVLIVLRDQAVNTPPVALIPG
jgi:hypothetical protein